MKLIDADEVIEKLKENATEMEADIYYGSNIGVPVDEIEDIVNECKTINQKQGRWIENKYGDVTCSCCNMQYNGKESYYKTKFCAYCGAELCGVADEVE